MPALLQHLSQTWGKLAQFGSHRAIVCSECQNLLVKLHHMAGTHQGGWRELFVMPLQGRQLLYFTGELAQFPTGVEI